MAAWRAAFGFFLGLAALASPEAGTAAQGRQSRDPCRVQGRETECFVAHEAEYLASYGLAPAAQHLAAGTEIRRAWFIDGNGRETVAVEFRRAAGSPPTVSIYLPARLRGPGDTPPAATAPVPRVDWDMLARRGRLFDRALAPRPARRDGMITVCSHAWVYFVEYTDPAADNPDLRLRRRVESACEHGATADYAFILSDVAVRLIPGCAALDSDTHGSSALLLNVCARFSGDTVAAAQAYDEISELRGGGSRDQMPLLQRILSRAALVWDGETIPGDAAEAWLARTSGERTASFFVDRVHGENARRVRMTGFLERWIDGSPSSVLERAPVELVWVQHYPGYMRVERAAVGAFAVVDPSARRGS